MIQIDQFKKIYLHRRFADFRKSINGLSEIVQDSMDLDPFGKYLFVIANVIASKYYIGIKVVFVYGISA